MSQFYKDSIFWIEVEKIKPNPFQPRRDFDPAQLQSLADSIRQYGVLQALVVTRKEVQKDDGLVVEYELIAGERRLRASKLAGLSVVPVLIKDGDETDQMKLELAIIENLQREDLNVVDRAIAFKRLADEFGFKHITIAEKVGKSREYVSNSIRVLNLNAEIIDALKAGKISEGHTRPLLMLIDRPEEQMTLLKEIILRKMTVREAELISRRIALDRARIKGDMLDMQTREIEDRLTESLGTRVVIEKKHEAPGGKVTIAFFSEEDLKSLLSKLKNDRSSNLEVGSLNGEGIKNNELEITNGSDIKSEEIIVQQESDPVTILDDRSEEEIKKADNTEDDEELYSIKNFSL